MDDDSGAVAVTIAVLVVAFVALSAIVVDAGYLYDTRRQLQAAAEAGALAGCQELIATGDAAAAQTVAEEYTFENSDAGPGDELTIESIDIDVAEGSVRVVAFQETGMFFSSVLGPATRPVRAAARAQKWQLGGGRYLVPWAIPVIRNIDTVEAATLDDKGHVINSTSLDEVGPLLYSGPLPAPAASGSYDVRVRVFNTHGVPEYIIDSKNGKEAPAGVAVVDDGTGLVADVALSANYVEAGSALPLLTVVTNSPEAAVSVEVDGVDRAMTSSDGTTWRYQIVPGDVDDDLDLLRVYPLDAYVGSKADGDIDAYLYVRRSTYPLAGAWISPEVAAPSGTIGVAVEFNEFDPVTATPGQTYTLRVGAQSGLVGNFGELNYNKIIHEPTHPENLVVPKPGNNYEEWTAYGYEGGVHLGDIIEMSPGSSGVNTQKALDERADNMLPGEDMIVAVPVVEKYEDKSGGAYDVIVIAFAAFKITYYDKSGNVEGEFLQYIANPTSFLDDPGSDPNAIYAARLVNP